MAALSLSVIPRNLRKPGAFACLIALLGLTPHSFCQSPAESLEYKVKAAFLLNFIKFVEWPPSSLGPADSPIPICVLGNDPFGNALTRTVEGEAVDGRKLAVVRIKKGPVPGSCRVVFSSRPMLELGHGVLTVGEGEDFLHEGGMIAFVIDNRRVRFDINQTVAENAGLKLSAKLLSVARAVEK